MKKVPQTNQLIEKRSI